MKLTILHTYHLHVLLIFLIKQGKYFLPALHKKPPVPNAEQYIRFINKFVTCLLS